MESTVSCLLVLGAVTLEWSRILQKLDEDTGAETSGAAGDKRVEETGDQGIEDFGGANWIRQVVEENREHFFLNSHPPM